MLLRSFAWVLTLLTAGCASPGVPDPEFGRLTRAAVIPDALEHRLDPLDAHAVARQGDSVLARVVAETSAGLVQRFVRLTLLGTMDGEGLPAADIQFATGVTGQHGEALQTTSTTRTVDGESSMELVSTSGLILVDVLDPEGALLASRHVGAEVLVCTGSAGPPNRATLQPGLAALLELILATPELDALLMEVARRPPLWSLLNGTTLELALQFEDLQTPEGGLVRHAASISADGLLALEGNVEQGPKCFPYLLTAGIRKLEARHPERGDRRASIEVVASTRGAGLPLVDSPTGPFPAPDEDARIPGYRPSPAERGEGTRRTISGSFE